MNIRPGPPPSSYRQDWRNFSPDSNLKGFRGLDETQTEQKVAQLNAGGEMAEAYPPIPEHRRCADVFFGLLFILLTLSMVALCAANFEKIQNLRFGTIGVTELAVPLAGGAVAALIAAVIFVQMMKSAPACVVWTSLLLSPCLLIIMGGVLFALGQAMAGGIFVAMGLCLMGCVFVCWRPFIPFTIQLTEVLADVIKQYPSLLVVPIMGTVFAILWPLLTLLTAVAVQELLKNDMAMYAFVFVLFWGGMVSYYWNHVVLCGVFGRWYYSKDQASAVSSSIKVASTSAFGSICCGALLIAAIRTLEFAIAHAKQQAAEDGNQALMIILCVLECLIRCVADIIEYFSEWAFVQVAVRGTTFWESAKITFTMITCGNLEYIISDLLIDSVASLATLMCAAFGLGVGGALMMSLESADFFAAGAAAGFVAGLMVGSSVGTLVTSGAKTILVSWAEKPEVLAKNRPETHNNLANKVIDKRGE